MRKLSVFFIALLVSTTVFAQRTQVSCDCDLNECTYMVKSLLEELKGRDVVLFGADKDEISPSEVPFPVVFTGMGKMRMFSSLVKWRESLPEGRTPVVLNIGSAYPE